VYSDTFVVFIVEETDFVRHVDSNRPATNGFAACQLLPLV
jgi:hypothetical protein